MLKIDVLVIINPQKQQSYENNLKWVCWTTVYYLYTIFLIAMQRITKASGPRIWHECCSVVFLTAPQPLNIKQLFDSLEKVCPLPWKYYYPLLLLSLHFYTTLPSWSSRYQKCLPSPHFVFIVTTMRSGFRCEIVTSSSILRELHARMGIWTPVSMFLVLWHCDHT